MKLACEDHDHIAVISIRGELVSDELERLQSELDQRLEGQGRDFILDLSQTEFVDSQGLELLLNLQSRCADKLGQVRLVNCHDNVHQILYVTRLARRFDRHDDVEAAIKSLR